MNNVLQKNIFSRLKKISSSNKGLRLLKRRILRHFTKFTLIEGYERNSNQPISVLFSGSNLNKNYFEKLIFGQSDTKTKYIKVWKSKFAQYIVNANQKHDLVIIMSDEMPDAILHETNVFYVPCWVGGEKDLRASLETARYKKQYKNDLKRMQKNCFSYRITKDPKEFDRFYYNMHLPYIEKIYSDHAFLMQYDEMKVAIPKSELIYITQNNQDIAGSILVYDENNRVRAWSMGVKDGDIQWVKDGVTAASFHLKASYLLGKGFSKLHLGAVRPFLNDGALRFKKNRGMEIVDHTAKKFIILPLHNCAGVHGFLQNNPFVYLEEGALKGAIFLSKGEKLLTKDVEQLYHDWYLPGLDCLNLFNLNAAGCCEKIFYSSGYVDKTGSMHFH